MINYRLVLIPVTALFLSACFNISGTRQKPDITTDTLTYAYQHIKETAPKNGNQPDSTLATAKIIYPLFVNQNTLNDTLNRRISGLFGTSADKDLQTLAKNFVSLNNSIKKSDKAATKPFNLNIAATVVHQDSSLLCLRIDGPGRLIGGKQPYILSQFINWNTKSKKIIVMDSLITDGSYPKLTSIAETIFRKQENLKDTSSLKRDYFFKDGKFALNNNFVITQAGIRFLYNLYEIKPLNAGTTDVFIPYSQIRTLLKPNTVLAQYIKQ